MSQTFLTFIRSYQVDKDETRFCQLMDTYYTGLGLLRPEEAEVFWAAMRRSLPTTFRITASTPA